MTHLFGSNRQLRPGDVVFFTQDSTSGEGMAIGYTTAGEVAIVLDVAVFSVIYALPEEVIYLGTAKPPEGIAARAIFMKREPGVLR